MSVTPLASHTRVSDGNPIIGPAPAAPGPAPPRRPPRRPEPAPHRQARSRSSLRPPSGRSPLSPSPATASIHRRPRPLASLADANGEAGSDAHRGGAPHPSPPRRARNSPRRSQPSPTATTADAAQGQIEPLLSSWMPANSPINGRTSLTREPQPKGGLHRTRTKKWISPHMSSWARRRAPRLPQRMPLRGAPDTSRRSGDRMDWPGSLASPQIESGRPGELGRPPSSSTPTWT